jgi:hypothetical protein
MQNYTSIWSVDCDCEHVKQILDVISLKFHDKLIPLDREKFESSFQLDNMFTYETKFPGRIK